MAKLQNVIFSNEGRSHSINAADDKSVREVMAGQAQLSDRYIKIEPAVSASFGAPACYQKKTDERADLLAYLQSRHPEFATAEKLEAQQAAAKAKGDPTLAHRLGLDLAATWDKIHGDVNNAVRAMKKYFLNGNKGDRKQREELSPRQLMEACRAKLEKIADSADWPEVDRKVAKAGITAINGVIGAKTVEAGTPAAKVQHPERAAGKVTYIAPSEYQETAEA